MSNKSPALTLFDAVEDDTLVSFDGSFKLKDSPTSFGKDAPGKKKAKKLLAQQIELLHELQRVFYASNKHSLLLVFQAMDAAGKDSTIRTVFSGVNPAGFQTTSFKKPSPEELDHDFLWRTTRALPERGRIGIFNRSYYEEVLVVRVHPGILEGQRLPYIPDDAKGLDALFEQRLISIADYERHLANSGTVIVKFWLNVSRDEQKARFLERIDNPDKNWKFAMGDVRERALWPKYMSAYQSALRATSRPWAPWYAIPADDKPTMRLRVAEILVKTLKSLDLSYPELPPEEKARLQSVRAQLIKDDQ